MSFMNFKGDLTIVCEKNIYDAIVESINKFNESQDYKFRIHSVSKSENYYKLCWYGVRWYSDFEDVKSVEQVLEEFEDCEEAGYGYKKIVVTEEGYTDEYYNQEDMDYVAWIEPVVNTSESFSPISIGE